MCRFYSNSDKALVHSRYANLKQLRFDKEVCRKRAVSQINLFYFFAIPSGFYIMLSELFPVSNLKPLLDNCSSTYKIGSNLCLAARKIKNLHIKYPFQHLTELNCCFECFILSFILFEVGRKSSESTKNKNNMIFFLDRKATKNYV